jgi:hypothetical protein
MASDFTAAWQIGALVIYVPFKVSWPVSSVETSVFFQGEFHLSGTFNLEFFFKVNSTFPELSTSTSFSGVNSTFPEL